MKTEMSESQFKLDIEYLMRKPTSFNNFMDYIKRSNLFNQLKEFKLALVL